MNEEYKVGDRVLVKSFCGGIAYHAHIKKIVKGFFYTKYMAEWKVDHIDYGKSYTHVGWIRPWNIAYKD